MNDDVGSITGNVANNNGITDDTRPTISGTGEPGSLVSLYDNGILLTTVLIGTSGSWSYTVAANQAFTPGEHQLTVTSLDAAGNSTAQPAVITINVDTSKPDAPTIATATDDVGSIQGNLLTESRSDDNLPELNGTGPEGTSITLYDGDIPIATFAVPTGGNWSYQLTQPLSEGSHTLTAIATNAAGTASNAGTFILTIDTTPPTAPVILAAEGLVGDTSLSLNNGGSTKSTSPELTGSGEPGATITVYDNDTEIGTAVVQTDGTWSFTPPEALDEGSIFSPPQQLTSQVTPASCRLASRSMLITRHRRSLVRRQSATIAIRSPALSLMAIPTTPHQPLAAQAPLVMSFRFILMTTPLRWDSNRRC